MNETFAILRPAGFIEIGRKENQEDALFPALGTATAQCRVFMVCDGMGGHEHGEVASACVAGTVGCLTADAPPCNMAAMRWRFEQALAEAYRRLDELDTPPSADGRSMGTTLTFLALCTDGALVAHIGDSRVYQFRPGEGVVFRTRDHSLVSDLIAAGELDEEQVRTFPQRNIITRAVQPHQEHPAEASFKQLTDLRPGDVFFLCCDGVLEQLDDRDLEAILLSRESLENRIGALRRACAERQTHDNYSCYAVELKRGVPAPAPRRQHGRRRLWPVVAMLLALITLAAAFLWLRPASSSPQEPGATQGLIHRQRR